MRYRRTPIRGGIKKWPSCAVATVCGVKRCNACRLVKSRGEFYPAKAYKDGLRGDCKMCVIASNRESRRRQRAGVKGVVRVEKCKVCDGEFSYLLLRGQPRRVCSDECSVVLKRAHGHKQRLKKYELSDQEYLALVERFGGLCGCCGRELPGHEANIDHCHTTGVVRGILCRSCNWGIGHLGDDLESVRNAVRYLESCA